MEYIKREEAINYPVMPKEYRKYQTLNLDDAYEQGWEDLQSLLDKLPRVEVVRCKDCQCWDLSDSTSGHPAFGECIRFAKIRTHEDDYCSRGLETGKAFW